ncbi:MAG: nuclear transport factor 2 family protein [Frankiales bacterium]|nr:nuclear transport factor 2 family protein [Frankiales bacterium]MCW3017373.1 nuclear transport factor 2 family protein [Solirubrobacterales bacterium]
MPAKRNSLLPSLLAPPALAVVMIVAGCGAGKQDAGAPQTQVKAAVQRFGAASARKDYQLICDKLIAQALSDNVEQLGLPCEQAFKQGLDAVRGAKLRIDSVRVTGVTAFAQVHTTAIGQPPSDDTLKLVKVGQAWRIVSLSAGNDPGAKTPTAQKPTAKKPG